MYRGLFPASVVGSLLCNRKQRPFLGNSLVLKAGEPCFIKTSLNCHSNNMLSLQPAGKVDTSKMTLVSKTKPSYVATSHVWTFPRMRIVPAHFWLLFISKIIHCPESSFRDDEGEKASKPGEMCLNFSNGKITFGSEAHDAGELTKTVVQGAELTIKLECEVNWIASNVANSSR